MAFSKSTLLLLCLASAILLATARNSKHKKLGECGDACKGHEDCAGELACMEGNKCGDDPFMKTAICLEKPKGCGAPCKKHKDCLGKLACMDGKCGDDPWLRTRICKKEAAPPPTGAEPPFAGSPMGY